MSEHTTASGNPRCWAMHPSGVRCEGDAGHADRHLSALRWSDEEAMAPGRLPPVPAVAVGPDLAPSPPAAPVKPRGLPGQIRRAAPEDDCRKCGHPLSIHERPVQGSAGECLESTCAPCGPHGAAEMQPLDPHSD